MIRAASLVLILLWVAVAAQVQADGLRLRFAAGLSGGWSDGSSYAASLGMENRFSQSGSARLMWDKSVGDFRFQVHSHLSYASGDNIGYAAALLVVLPTPSPATLFNLTSTISSSGSHVFTNTIDRLSVTYAAPSFVIKVGRQAITWGSGLAFHPGDIVAPFSPNTVDTAYKPGADMIYAQYLFDNGADIQAIALPRPATTGGPVMYTSSTYALRTNLQLGSLDASAMFALDRGDTVSGVGLSGALGGASWNAEYIHWALSTGAVHPSWLFNISNFGTLGNWNISYFAEYYHNGFGVASSVDFLSFPASLKKRMSAGQVFYGGTDFLALGGQVQVNADLSFAPNAVISLNDGSLVAGLVVNYTLGDNTNLVFSYSHPIGAHGSEFGGRETTSGSGIYVGPSQYAVMQLVHFF